MLQTCIHISIFLYIHTYILHMHIHTTYSTYLTYIHAIHTIHYCIYNTIQYVHIYTCNTIPTHAHIYNIHTHIAHIYMYIHTCHTYNEANCLNFKKGVMVMPTCTLSHRTSSRLPPWPRTRPPIFAPTCPRYSSLRSRTGSGSSAVPGSSSLPHGRSFRRSWSSRGLAMCKSRGAHRQTTDSPAMLGFRRGPYGLLELRSKIVKPEIWAILGFRQPKRLLLNRMSSFRLKLMPPQPDHCLLSQLHPLSRLRPLLPCPGWYPYSCQGWLVDRLWHGHRKPHHVLHDCLPLLQIVLLQTQEP